MKNSFPFSVWPWRIGASLLAHLCLALVSCAWSQALPPEPSYYPPLPPGQPYQAGLVPQANVPIGPINSGYWVISSRHCKNQLLNNQPCEFVVYHFEGQSGRQSSLEELYASLPPQVPVCFMVHGSFVVWESALTDSAGTYRWLRNAAPERPIQMIFYTWPSDDSSRLLPNAVDVHDARIMGRRAELNSVYLAQLVLRVPNSNPVCLIGHSHGARMVSATLHLLNGGAIEGRCLTRTQAPLPRIRTVLAAAAMDHDWFNPGERYDRALLGTEAVVNVRNRRDLPLFFHPTHALFASRALGRAGLTNHDESLLGQQRCVVSECDVTDLIGYRHFWPNYYRQPSIARAIRHFVYFDE